MGELAATIPPTQPTTPCTLAFHLNPTQATLLKLYQCIREGLVWIRQAGTSTTLSDQTTYKTSPQVPNLQLLSEPKSTTT